MMVGFWVLALLWLPAVEVGDYFFSVVLWMDRMEPPIGYPQVLMGSVPAFLILAPMGSPSALLCRELWRLGYRRMAWSAGAVVFAAAVAIISSDGELIYELSWTVGKVALAPNLLTMIQPVWIVVYPAIAGVVIWIAAVALQRRGTPYAETNLRISIHGVGFWLLALLWLPAEVIGGILIEFLPSLGATPSEDELRVFLLPLVAVPMGEVQMWVRLLPMFATTLFVFSPAGLMIALPCRQLWCLGYLRTAWTVGAVAALSTAALVSLAMELFLLVAPPEFVGTTGWIVGTLYYAGQTLPSDIAVYLAFFNLPFLAVVVLLGQRERTRNGGPGIDEGGPERKNGVPNERIGGGCGPGSSTPVSAPPATTDRGAGRRG